MGEMVASLQFGRRASELTENKLPLVRIFGHEHCGMLDSREALPVIEYAVVTAECTQIETLAVRAVLAVARELLRNFENHTVVLLSPDVALASARVGWVEMPASEAARVQFAAAGRLATRYNRHGAPAAGDRGLHRSAPRRTRGGRKCEARISHRLGELHRETLRVVGRPRGGRTLPADSGWPQPANIRLPANIGSEG